MLTIKALLESSEPLILPLLSIFLEQGLDDSNKGGSLTNDEWFMNDVQMILKTKIPPQKKPHCWLDRTVHRTEHHLNYGTDLNFSKRINKPFWFGCEWSLWKENGCSSLKRAHRLRCCIKIKSQDLEILSHREELDRNKLS